VLGFKPLASLSDYHQIREPTFIYPDEKRMPGSTSAFIALHGQVSGTCFIPSASFL
jgi:ATP-dependent DNA helicase 2 subunit 1